MKMFSLGILSLRAALLRGGAPDGFAGFILDENFGAALICVAECEADAAVRGVLDERGLVVVGKGNDHAWSALVS